MWEWISGPMRTEALLFGIGAVAFLFFSVALAIDFRRKSRLLATMKRTPTSRIANAQPGLVELVGVAVSAGKLVTAPLTGKPCVYFHVLVDEPSGSSRSTVIDDQSWCDFYVDDGSGAVARLTGPILHVKTATRILDTEHADAVQRFLAARGITKTASEIKQYTWFEERVDVGAPVYVLGEGRAAPPPPGGRAYGADAPRERLLVVAPEGGELVVAVGSEAALVAKLRREVSFWGKMLALMVVLAVGFGATTVFLLAG
jgi:hypothetical protein